MPQFAIHTPMTSQDLRASINKSKLSKTTLPIGLIGESKGLNFVYGYDGDKYYVAESVFEYLVTRVHLTFDEAKELFNALVFIDKTEPLTKSVSLAIKEARKQKLSGGDLFWFLTDNINY
jgi:hypothetical protein